MGYSFNPFTGNLDLTGSGGSGNVVAPPTGATDNAVPRFDGTTGQQLKDSLVIVNDDGDINTPGAITTLGVLADTVETTGDLIVGGVIVTTLTPEKVVITDASGNLTAAGASSTEVDYLVGVTSSVQNQIDSKIDLTEKAAPLGVATLDGGGKIPASQLPSSVMSYLGLWDASTNTPTLADGTGDAGDVYQTSVAGTVNFGAGPIVFAIGDWAVYSGSVWQRSINSNAVASVNGFTGIVILTTTDVAEGSNEYFTDERAQDAVGNILVTSSSVLLDYDDATPAITAEVIASGVNHDGLLNFVANKHIDHTTVSIATAAGTSGLAGGGTIAATRNLVVDIVGTTAKSVPANNDLLLLYDTSGANLKSTTKAQLFAGYALSSPGDITETSFSAANNQVSPANITGFAFANASVRSFAATVSINLQASSSLYAEYSLRGIQRGANWSMSQDYEGDDTGVTFTITTAGQIQYTSGNSAGFTSDTIKFRAITTS